MTKTANVLIFILLLPFLSPGQVQRLILVEEFTNASSVSCAIQNQVFDALLSVNSDKVVAIKYHVDWPGDDPMATVNISEPDARLRYYGIPANPFTLINGSSSPGLHYAGAPVNVTQAALEAVSTVPSPVLLDLSYSKSSHTDSIYVTLVIKAIQTVSGQHLAAQIAVEEKTVEYSSAPGSNGEKTFSNVLRKLLPDANGTALPASFNAGDSLVIIEKWALTGIADKNQLCVAAWVQDNDTRGVLQAAFSPPSGPACLDATPIAVIKPDKTVCGNTLTPRLLIKNLGGAPLTSLEINYSINGGPASTYNWTGSLDFIETREVNLPPLSFVSLPGLNKLLVFTSNPNGNKDSVPGNDTIIRLFKQSYTVGTPVNLEIKTDQYPAETTWKVINSSGNIVAQGGPYIQPNIAISQLLNFSSGDCYEFIIFDHQGDGICCNYGGGYYKLKDQHGIVFAQGSAFDVEESVPFFVDMTMGIPAPELISDFQVFPNPFDNTATISLFLPRDMNVTIMVMNEVGQFVYVMDKVILKAGNHTFDLNGETWTPGIYFVKILTGDKLITRKLSLTK